MKRQLLSLTLALFGAWPLTPVVAAPRTDADGIRLRIDVDRDVLPCDTTEKAVVKIALDGIKLPRAEARPPVNLALVIDRSGSMSGEKIEKAREAALEAVRRLAPDDIASLVIYDTHAQTLVPAQRVGDGSRLEAAISRIFPGGSTALYDGVSLGATEVRRYMEDRAYVNRIILLSDGLANVGPSSPADLGRLGGSLVREGISVTTIGLGLGYNEDLMTRLAQRSDGNTYFVENSRDLPNIFASELGDVLSVVARRVVIEVEFPDGVRPLRFVGRDGTVHGRRAELTLNQVYGGQEKYALIEVEVAPAKSGAEREIAQARVRYDDAVNGRQATLTANRKVQFSATRSVVIQSANHQVQTDYAANVLALAKDEAVALVDANRNVEAGALLRQRASELQSAAKTYSNSAMQSLAAPAAADADKLEAEGLSVTKRKIYRTESNQTRNQQSSSAPFSR